MNKLLTILTFIYLFQGIGISQEVNSNNWKQNKKLAEELLQKRNFAEAAKYFEKAHELKPAKTELLSYAAENYLLVRDFRKAAHTFGQLKNSENYPLAGMKYALSLKQDKRYDDATIEFTNFISNYKGTDKAILTDQVQLEIEGCQFALDQRALSATSPYAITHLNSKINTNVSEFGPIQYSDDILYYSSMVKGKANLFRSQKNDGNWSKGIIPRGFQKLAEDHFCNGSFTPTGDRFYFTICEQDENGGELTARCEIYVTMKKGASWKAPIKLPEYINLPNKTATQPFVVHKGDKEILYFSSNRAAGQGGMDLWFIEKEIDSEGTDFTFPENLGPNINTRGDEITPFFHLETESLYFSSTGHLTMGGFDILKSVGHKTSWSTAENLGAPFNSSADDTYFSLFGDTETGYFVSNRRFGIDKILTTQEDIFSFSKPGQQYAIRGFIFDELNRPLEEVYIYLYEFLEDEERRLLTTQTIDHTGSYEFRLQPGKRFQLALQKENFAPATEYFNTLDETMLLIEKNMTMSRINPQAASASTETIVTLDETPQEVKNINTEDNEEMVIEEPNAPEIEVEELVQEEIEPREELITKNEEILMETPIVNEEVEVENIDIQEDVQVVKTETITTKETVVMEPINETSKEVITFVIDGDQIKSVDINNGNTSGNSNVNAPTNNYTNSNTTNNYAPNPPITTNNVYTTREILTGKGTTSVPSGTGIYTYDEYNNNYRKEGGSATVNTFTNNAPSTYVNSAPIANTNSSDIRSDAPFVSGTYYKIQLIAVEFHTASNKRYDGVRNLGKRFDTEYIVEKGWTRVLLADCMSKTEADKILNEAQSKGFERAYIVKYRDGERIGRIK